MPKTSMKVVKDFKEDFELSTIYINDQSNDPMNIPITAAEGITCIPVLESGIIQPVLRSLMDDLTIMLLHVQARWVLETLEVSNTHSQPLWQDCPSRQESPEG